MEQEYEFKFFNGEWIKKVFNNTPMEWVEQLDREIHRDYVVEERLKKLNKIRNESNQSS